MLRLTHPRAGPAVGLWAALALGGCGASPSPPSLAELDRFIVQRMSAHHLSGVATAIVVGDQLVWCSGFGLADRERARAVTCDTLFVLESISKPVGMTALMQLRDEGRLDLDADLDGLLPFSVKNPAFPSAPVTARQLLSHTSSIRDDFTLLARTTAPGDSPVTLEQFARGYLVPGGDFYGPDNWSREDGPGAKRAYSNAGIGLAGYVTELAGQEGFAERDRRTVLEPLGMHRTGWRLAEVEAEALATPYAWNSNAGYEPQVPRGSGFFPSHMLHSSARELSRFLRAFMQRGALDGVRILDEGTVAEMLDPEAKEGLAWEHENELGGMRLLGHGGAGLGNTHLMYFRPDRGTGAIVLTNSDAAIRAKLGDKRAMTAIEEMVVRLLEVADGL